MPRAPLFLLTITAATTCVLAEETHCYELIYPSCRLETYCGWGAYLTGEALYWSAREHGLIYGQSGAGGIGPQTEEIPPESFNFRGRSYYASRPDWSWGFRVGLGYNFCYDDWEAKAIWTSYHKR
jgi:hypothetical protein